MATTCGTAPTSRVLASYEGVGNTIGPRRDKGELPARRIGQRFTLDSGALTINRVAVRVHNAKTFTGTTTLLLAFMKDTTGNFFIE